jgi:hypothetical protein
MIQFTQLSYKLIFISDTHIFIFFFIYFFFIYNKKLLSIININKLYLYIDIIFISYDLALPPNIIA